MAFRLSLLLLIFASNSFAQQSLLQSGPMLGYAEMKEALIWVQTNTAATVQCTYWNVNAPKERYKTEPVKTIKASAFTAKLIADEVEPGQTYEYRILINDQELSFNYPTQFKTQAIWRWRTDPPDFSIALGSCTYINESIYDRPGDPYGSNYQIFESINSKQPDAMIWLGDNTYLREADWYSRTGILHRYTHTRSTPEMQALLASANHFAIWDDHDFGPNDSDRSYIYKDITLEAFELFWGNPSFGLPDQKGTTSFFQYNDMDFFLLDNRYFRSPNYRSTTERTILGKEQLEWLIDALTSSQAPFKLVAIGGQVLNTAENAENYIHHHPEERAYLLRRIEEENIKGVVFLTGDRHHSSLSQYTNNRGNIIYDLTVSPLTSGPYAPNEQNDLQVEGTLVSQHNFGLLNFSGPREERKLQVQVFDCNGKVLWERELKCN